MRPRAPSWGSRPRTARTVRWRSPRSPTAQKPRTSFADGVARTPRPSGTAARRSAAADEPAAHRVDPRLDLVGAGLGHRWAPRSEEHTTSELQSRGHLVCRLLL